MKLLANAALCVLLAIILWPGRPLQPTPPAPIPIVAGVGAINVDMPDEYVAAFAKLVSTRRLDAAGWTFSLADDCVFRVQGDTVHVNGGVLVRGTVLRVPVRTSIRSIKVQPGRLVVDLNGVPLDVVVE